MELIPGLTWWHRLSIKYSMNYLCENVYTRVMTSEVISEHKILKKIEGGMPPDLS